jgi:hypothetical protein
MRKEIHAFAGMTIKAFAGMTIKALAGMKRLVRSKREVTNKYKEGGLFFLILWVVFWK